MFLKRQYRQIKPVFNIWRLGIFPRRNYSEYTEFYQPDTNKITLENDSEAAEANPMKYFYQEDVLQQIVESQRMLMLEIENSEERYLNIKGVYPEVVEDFNFNALPEPEESQLVETDTAEIQLDRLSPEDAFDIIIEMNKDEIV